MVEWFYFQSHYTRSFCTPPDLFTASHSHKVRAQSIKFLEKMLITTVTMWQKVESEEKYMKRTDAVTVCERCYFSHYFSKCKQLWTFLDIAKDTKLSRHLNFYVQAGSITFLMAVVCDILTSSHHPSAGNEQPRPLSPWRWWLSQWLHPALRQ